MQQMKNWLAAFLPLLLVLAVLLYFNVDRRYATEDITPEFCVRLICQEYKQIDRKVRPENVQVIDIQQIDELLVVGYQLDTDNPVLRSGEKEFGCLLFRQYEDCWRLASSRTYFYMEAPEIGSAMIDTGYASGSRNGYMLVLSTDEKLHRVELWVSLDTRVHNKEYTLFAEAEADVCPIMLFLPRPAESWRGEALFLDENGQKIDWRSYRQTDE